MLQLPQGPKKRYNHHFSHKIEPMRLAQYLALCGLCSRKEASRRITQGRISYQGRTANHTDTIEDPVLPQLSSSAQTESSPQDKKNKVELSCDGIPIGLPQVKQYWLYNKPVGIDCRLLPDDSHSLYHVIKHLPRLFPVGRLDKDSRGLLLLTNDGNLSHRLMHPSFVHQKRYHVQVDKEIDSAFIHNMSSGVNYRDITTLPCQVTPLGSDRFEIILTQGLNRQIRRMSQALGYKVIDLKRVAIGDLKLTQLAESDLRPLEDNELKLLPLNDTSQ